MPSHGLTDRQLGILRDILTPYAEKIERVGLFGSRATGKARANSDIDMVLYGTLDETDIDRLRTLFDESGLALKVDLVGYSLVDYPPFKKHIDNVMQILLTQSDLRTGKL